jgi:NAD-dependent SIR2 family protein deacetylase
MADDKEKNALDRKKLKQFSPELEAYYVNTLKNPQKAPKETKKMKRMDVDEQAMHGAMGAGQGWAAPFCTNFCDKVARPGYSDVKAHEYSEDPATLWEKVKMLAGLIRMSEHFVLYTGAGISTASGINDYATKVTKLAPCHTKPKPKPHEAEPTFAHFVLTAMHKEGLLRHWIQQNHDGLPQKAGYPQNALNEIHGAWFDPSNPVVPMSGSLRDDLCEWMREEEKKADLVLAMGTSLCGMNADRLVSKPGKRYMEKDVGLGAVIVGYQQTRLDHLASLRIYASIDKVMVLLAHHLNIPVNLDRPSFPVPNDKLAGSKHAFTVPYTKEGKLADDGKTTTTWDLTPGKKIRLTSGPGKGFEGEVSGVPKHDFDQYWVKFPCTREGPTLGFGMQIYCLGAWWIPEVCEGKIPELPFVNID